MVSGSVGMQGASGEDRKTEGVWIEIARNNAKNVHAGVRIIGQVVGQTSVLSGATGGTLAS